MKRTMCGRQSGGGKSRSRPAFEWHVKGDKVKCMKQLLTILAMATLLVGCRSSQEQGGTGAGGVEPAYGHGSDTNNIQNLPGGDVRAVRDGDSLYGTGP